MKKGEIKLPSDVKFIDVADKILEEINDLRPLSEEIYGNILLSLSEAISNAIIHGNRFDKNKFVYITYELYPNKLILTVKDEGNGFDPDKLPDPTTPENLEKLHSRGVFIIKHLCDDIKFEYQNGQKVVMTFKLNEND